MPKLYFYDVGLVSWLLGIQTQEQITTHPLREIFLKHWSFQNSSNQE